MGLEYRWDASHPTPKIFLAQLIVDGSRKNVKRFTTALTFPRYQVDGSAELFRDPGWFFLGFSSFLARIKIKFM